MKTCPVCHAKAGDDASTCFECLYSFSQSSARGIDAAVVGGSAPSGLSDARATNDPEAGVDLVVRGTALGDSQRRRVRSMRGSIYVGSGPFNDIVIGDPRVARRAVHLYRDGNQVWVEPLADGTALAVNGMPLGVSAELRVGDVVEIGGVGITVGP